MVCGCEVAFVAAIAGGGFTGVILDSLPSAVAAGLILYIIFQEDVHKCTCVLNKKLLKPKKKSK